MTVIGGSIRMLVLLNGNFWWVVAGCTIIGSAAPFQMGGLSVLANYWFGDKERGKATAIMTVSNPLGMLVGFAIQGIYGARIDF
jgi:MFS family permease